MNTTSTTRPSSSPAYYLGRSASTWQNVLPRRTHPAARSQRVADVTPAAVLFVVGGGSRWN
jgi:hypothetical protein